MSSLDKYLKGELEKGKTSLPEVLTPEILKLWRDIPNVLRIETTNKCNASCQFCAQPLMERKKGNMTHKLFKKIIDQCVEFNPTIIKPYLHGELLVDPKWKDRLSYIDKKLTSRVHIETNAALLDEDATDFLMGLKRLHTISFNCSIPSVDKCLEITGLDFIQVRDNVIHFLETCKSNRKQLNVNVLMVASPSFQTVRDGQMFRQMWGPLGHTKMSYNYAGKLRDRGVLHTNYCTGLTEMCILRDGKVGLCWMDLEGEEVIGNANKELLVDIWNSDRIQEIRAYHRRSERSKVPICNRCDFC